MFATVLAFALLGPGVPDDGVAEGLSVGNSPPALPPGLSDPLEPVVSAPMDGRAPMGSGAELVEGVGMAPVGMVGGAVSVTVADARGSLGRCAALATTESRTDVSEVFVVGTVTWASSCRLTDCEAISPRSHFCVPSLVPQPKLNCVGRPAGEASSRTMASGTLPPVVQALTIQVAGKPRSMLAWER